MIHHGDTEQLLHEELTEKSLAPPSKYIARLSGSAGICLRGMPVPRTASARVSIPAQVSLPVEYKSVKLDCGYRLDLVVQDSVVLS